VVGAPSPRRLFFWAKEAENVISKKRVGKMIFL
jgi:hypothetical protein